MILFFSLGCKLSIHTLGIFIGPWEVGQKIDQTNTQTNTLTYANFNIDSFLSLWMEKPRFEDPRLTL